MMCLGVFNMGESTARAGFHLTVLAKEEMWRREGWRGEEMVSDAKRLKKLQIQDLIWTDKLCCLICSFVLPAWRKETFYPHSFSLHFLSLTPPTGSQLLVLPILTFSHGERFLSGPGRFDTHREEGSGLLRGGGVRRGDGPRGGGQTTREHACIIKTGQRCESKAWNLY